MGVNWVISFRFCQILRLWLASCITPQNSNMNLKSLCSILKILFRDGVHNWTREKFITAWLSHCIGKSKDKYNCQDKAGPLSKSEQALWTFNSFKTVRRDWLVERVYQMVVVARPLHWGKMIIFFFNNWKMNPSKNKKETIFKRKL